jgi:hypothetical protein
MPPFDFICVEAHEDEDRDRQGPVITVHESLWAFCNSGGYRNHAWQRVSPSTVDEVRALARERVARNNKSRRDVTA